MEEKPQVAVSRMIIRPLLTRLLNATSEDEAMRIGLQLQNFVLQGEPREAIYVFAYESWDAVESILRVGETQFNIKSFNQLPHEMQTTVVAVSTIWEALFRKFPREMSYAFVEIFDKSDSATRRRFTWFSLPISRRLGRDMMDIAAEQLTSKR